MTLLSVLFSQALMICSTARRRMNIAADRKQCFLRLYLVNQSCACFISHACFRLILTSGNTLPNKINNRSYVILSANLCVCVCVCVCACVHVRVRAYVCVQTHVCVHSCSWEITWKLLSTCVCVDYGVVYSCVHVCLHVSVLPVHLNFLPLTWLMRLLASLRG